MIDIDNFLFESFYNALVSEYPNANISSGYDEKKAVYPSVVLRVIGNVPYQFSNTDACAENHTRITVEVEVESNKVGTARSECSKILADADTIMQGMKFRRIYMSQARNIDRTVWQKYARYEVIVEKPTFIYEGTASEITVYQMYRR